MSPEPDFDQIANRICEAIESPGRSIVEVGDQIAEQLRLVWNARGEAEKKAIHEAVVRLSPWTAHHQGCARVTDADECDCGLQAELKNYAWSC